MGSVRATGSFAQQYSQHTSTPNEKTRLMTIPELDEEEQVPADDVGFLLAIQPPNLHLHLSLGHKRGAWYLLFAREYPTADSREVVRLSLRGTRPSRSETGRPRFWFDPKAFTGWEGRHQTLLGYLLQNHPDDPRILEIKRSKPLPRGKGIVNEVEVLVHEAALLRWCEGCGTWESIADLTSPRWVLVRQKGGKGSLPGFLCDVCYQKRTLRSRAAHMAHRLTSGCCS
ncbi:hypothetical protein HGRIS_001942 [Hohenbuehelia grisea]|uniref:Uncharacterized protein n=1 Tax=Hohenbuehelia grisea TaxID=104357 RepID=A0ABR3JJR3_9AGAR